VRTVHSTPLTSGYFDMDNMNGKFQRTGNLRPAQRGVATQAAAANKYSQEAIRDGNNSRTQAHLQQLFENNNVPKGRAKLLADRWRAAVEVKYASEQTLAHRTVRSRRLIRSRQKNETTYFQHRSAKPAAEFPFRCLARCRLYAYCGKP